MGVQAKGKGHARLLRAGACPALERSALHVTLTAVLPELAFALRRGLHRFPVRSHFTIHSLGGEGRGAELSGFPTARGMTVSKRFQRAAVCQALVCWLHAS